MKFLSCVLASAPDAPPAPPKQFTMAELKHGLAPEGVYRFNISTISGIRFLVVGDKSLRQVLYVETAGKRIEGAGTWEGHKFVKMEGAELILEIKEPK